MSALARLVHASGVTVTGTDVEDFRTTLALKELGIEILLGPYQAQGLPKNADLVVHTSDAVSGNPEVDAARSRGLAVASYSEALPLVLASFSVIGTAGTHGKTTTTGMLGAVLQEAKMDPAVIVGSFFKEFDGHNARAGHGKYAVVEADEYRRAFHNYKTNIAIITNVEADHLNYYKDLDDIYDAFRVYLRRIPGSGFIAANGDDAGAQIVTKNLDSTVIFYGLAESNDVRAINVQLEGERTTFDVIVHGKPLGSFKLKVPGAHNVFNALGVIAVAQRIGVPLAAMQKSLEEFGGAWRRFEYVGEKNGITVIDDFAHHPTELKATLKAAKERFGTRRIIAIYQPHFYGRLKDFFDDFVSALQLADEVIVAPVFYVRDREKDQAIKQQYNSETLAGAVTKAGTPARALGDLDAVRDKALGMAKEGDVLMTIGAGTITDISALLVERL